MEGQKQPPTQVANIFSDAKGVKSETEYEHLMTAAAEYASMVVESLVSEHLELPEAQREIEKDRSNEELQIHFLFPNLFDYERYLLLALRFANRGVRLMVNADTVNLNDDERHRHERSTTQIEELFVDARQQVEESGLIAKLSDVQRRIVEQEYLNVPFLESSAPSL